MARNMMGYLCKIHLQPEAKEKIRKDREFFAVF